MCFDGHSAACALTNVTSYSNIKVSKLLAMLQFVTAHVQFTLKGF